MGLYRYLGEVDYRLQFPKGAALLVAAGKEVLRIPRKINLLSDKQV